MTYIKTSLQGSLYHVTLNHPEKRNAMNAAMISELTRAFTEAPKEARMVLLRGNGASFCAGADLEYMKSMADYSYDENVEDSNKLSEMFYSLVHCPLPIIANIHGHAFGGALGLVAASDVIFAHTETKFCFSEVKLGLAPAVISKLTMARIGYTNARRLFLTGEVFTAEEALGMNLINFVYEDESGFEKQFDLIYNSITAGSASAQSKIKEMTTVLAGLHPQINLSEPEKITYLAEVIAGLRTGTDGQKRMKAFLERKK